MKKISLILFLCISTLYSCTKEQIKIDPDNYLIGVWARSNYENGLETFTRIQDFTDNYCYKFNSDGTLVERKNAGFCGTPPITFDNFPGTWEIINDTLIQVNGSYWGGTTSYKLDIETVSPTKLRVYTIQDN